MPLPDDAKVKLSSFTDLDVTNLASLADGDLWKSAVLTDTDPIHDGIEVYYDIDVAAFAADDHLRIGLLRGDGQGTEIWTGDVGEGEGQITTAAAVEAVEQAVQFQRHYGSANHGTVVKGRKVFPLLATDFAICISVEGTSIAAGTHVVRYRLFNTRIVD